MKFKNILPKLGVILVVIVGLASCEEDFSNIDTDIIEQNFTNPSIELPVKAYSKRLGGVQTNALLNYQLGIYDDPLYGKSTVNLLSQLAFDTNGGNPQFGNCNVLDSVVLYIPFFSTVSLEDGQTTYQLDSVYGNNPINIDIFESEFLLRDFDPSTGFEQAQRYYSNLDVEDNIAEEPIVSITDFVPSNEAIVLADETTIPPGLRVKLPIEFFQEKILDNEDQPVLDNNNNFKEFFRGLYFKVTPTDPNGTGNLFLFDLANSNNENIGVTLYSRLKALPSGETCENTTAAFQDLETRLLLNAISVNTYSDTETEIPADILERLNNPDVVNGEERLYVRGGDGIVTIVELFGDDVLSNDSPGEIIVGQGDDEEDLEDLREEGWIINEANLIFYVDQDRVAGGSTEPERIIIYETQNNRLLIDHSPLDLTSSNPPNEAYTEHLGPLERGSDENGDFYKIKITNHLSRLINQDSINSPLAVMVSTNVAQTDFQDLLNPIVVKEDATDDANDILLERVPATGIISPEGTVFHGNRSSDVAKRLKLQIFYTKPE